MHPAAPAPVRDIISDLPAIAATEAQAVASGIPGCGHMCTPACHGLLTCVRVRHANNPASDKGVDPRSGRQRPPGDVQPHLGYDPADGSLVQWYCYDTKPMG